MKLRYFLLILPVLIGLAVGINFWEEGRTRREELAVKKFIQRFYDDLAKGNDCEKVLSYFTPPSTREEEESYSWLSGKDLPGGACRLFLRVKIENPSIESVKRINEGIYLVEAKDNFSAWDNALSKWETKRRDVKFVILKLGKKLLIDKYIDSSPHEEVEILGRKYQAILKTKKYSGFGHEPLLYCLPQ